MRRFALCLLLSSCAPDPEAKKGQADDRIAVTAMPSGAVSNRSKSTTPTDSEPDPSGQTFRDGMQNLCDSVTKVDSTLSPSERQIAVAQWIDAHVKNTQVRELFSIMGQVPPGKRAGMMQAAAAKAGLETCAIAEQ